MTTDIHAEHTVAQHQHGPDCGHQAIEHGEIGRAHV